MHRHSEETCCCDKHEIKEIINSAVHHIPMVVCTLITKSALLTVPHELYHSIFLTQAAFYKQTRSLNKLVTPWSVSA